MKLTIEAKNLRQISKQLENRIEPAKKVLTATGNDMKKRVPGWVSTEVTGVYNIKKAEVMPAKKGKDGKWNKTAGSVRVAGTTVSSVTITYSGRVLTPTHFGMKPKKLTPGAKGKKRKRPLVSAEIKKGQRKVLGSAVFLGNNRGGGYIPFKRSSAKRYPVESVKTLSLPQMIDNPNVREQIEDKVNEELAKRLEHNISRFMK